MARRVYLLDRDSGERRALPIRRSRADAAIDRVLRAAAPLLEVTDLSGHLGRRAFSHALLAAAAIVAMARAMDWVIFGATPGGVPAFFTGIAAVCLMPSLVATGVRRLHDAGHGGWWMLLILVPVIGWALLAGLLSRPG